MKWFKHITALMLCISIVSAGFPVQARSGCPMPAQMQMQQMGMQDCKGCTKTAKQEPKKNGCCDDAVCAAKCSAMSGGVAMNLPATKAEFAAIFSQTLLLYPADAAIASAHLNSQERPPKSFA